MEQSIEQLGVLGLILLFLIKELFTYLKAKKNESNSNENNLLTAAIFKELQTMNNNHLHSIQDAIEQGNERLVDAIHSDNTKMIELLGEIKGTLNAK